MKDIGNCERIFAYLNWRYTLCKCCCNGSPKQRKINKFLADGMEHIEKDFNIRQIAKQINKCREHGFHSKDGHGDISMSALDNTY